MGIMTSSTTLADLATTHPAAARVFYRHRLDFCCGGRRPLSDVCTERGLDSAAVIAAIEAEERLPDDNQRWDVRPLTELVAFIVNTYHRRLRESLPELIRMATKVEMRHADKASCPRGLARRTASLHHRNRQAD